MTKTFNDLKRDYFYSQQSILPVGGTVWDYERAALSEALSKDYDKTIVPDDWRLYFESEGLDPSKNLSDLWYLWLGSKGFTQANLRDRLRAFYVSGGSL
jgi:hypothetical protein